MPGRSTTDPVFALRQLMERCREVKKDLHMVFRWRVGRPNSKAQSVSAFFYRLQRSTEKIKLAITRRYIKTIKCPRDQTRLDDTIYRIKKIKLYGKLVRRYQMVTKAAGLEAKGHNDSTLQNPGMNSLNIVLQLTSPKLIPGR